MVRYADPGELEWVESGGGPLTAVPEAVLPFWSGADGEGPATDYDRACDIDGDAALLPVGDGTALVLGGEPAATSYLPDHGVLVRWSAANSEEELLAGARAGLESAEWGSELRWRIPGPVVLFDSAWPGEGLAGAEHLRVPLEAGTYAVRAAYVQPEPETWIGLVRLTRLGP
ncbi:immunity 21 family protein [Streptomyces sp. NPDC005573]|uniref:immunity 21 family protein n=1 Tax=Streptomyces sp. NPDC005573 TaxID=3156890 RepID=UPI0033A57F1C